MLPALAARLGLAARPDQVISSQLDGWSRVRARGRTAQLMLTANTFANPAHADRVYAQKDSIVVLTQTARSYPSSVGIRAFALTCTIGRLR